MEKLIQELKEGIIKCLNLEDICADDINEKMPLFGEGGLGLDSIDALEIIVLLERNYGIRMLNAAEGRKVFTSIENIAKYVKENAKKNS
ncbi:MAG: acyl carrier protein [Bacteroidaceae bacterium]|nr:acyl carrier protein [Bacteroidaceae bacterium]